MFLFELLVAGDAVFGHANHNCIGFGEFWHAIGKVAGFLGAARGVVLRVEIENHILPLEIGQLDFRAIIGGHGKGGGFIANCGRFFFGHRSFSGVRGFNGEWCRQTLYGLFLLGD